MLNGDLKKEALNQLQHAHSNYVENVKIVTADSENLFVLRQKSSEEVIGSVEEYINRLANSPKAPCVRIDVASSLNRKGGLDWTGMHD
jgi:hypothetical protein